MVHLLLLIRKYKYELLQYIEKITYSFYAIIHSVVSNLVVSVDYLNTQ